MNSQNTKITQLDIFGNEIIEDVLLRDRFIEPPFSVLDTKTGNWQARKRVWENVGIKSEIGRDAKAYSCNQDTNGSKYDYMPDIKTGTSIFDPALTELMYKWFCPENGKILDPFAGGSVRGIVAQYLGYQYTGIELRQEQVDANRINSLEILPVNNQPNYYCGDSEKILDMPFNHKFDFLFSYPPYMDLEVYSDDPNDLSNMSDEEFTDKYKSIISKSCNKLKPGCYACFVVGDIRNKKTGCYKDLISITKSAFKDAGMGLYNDIVLLNVIGTAAIRAGKVFESGGKVTKIHQNVLVFKKAKE